MHLPSLHKHIAAFSTKKRFKPTSKMQSPVRVLKLFIISPLCLLFFLCNPEQASACNEADRAALVRFKASIVRDNAGSLSSWERTDCCGGDWEGIQCENGSVVDLSIENMELRGRIPSNLDEIKSLKSLSLSGNHFQGELPSSIGNLSSLILLNMGRNFLTGEIPQSFRNLRQLQLLDLSSNNLSGPLPALLGELPGLQHLYLSNNQFSGQIPGSICSLPQIQDISVGQNRLTGEIPSQIGGLKTLMNLDLSSNLLTGPIPKSLLMLPKLWSFNVSRNRLADPFPGSVDGGSMPSLLSIDLSYNNLHLGAVPDWIKRKRLYDVHLVGCHIQGTLPNFTSPEFLTTIDLSNNQITGAFGNFFTEMPNLREVKVSNNLIAGGFPAFGEGQSGEKLWLKLLDLSGNRLAGQIPGWISQLVHLERLDLSRNEFTGPIPESLGQLTSLQWLDLSVNGLTGKIPETMLGLEKMSHANFRANSLCGLIPQGRPFDIFPPAAYAHNRCLCGKPLPSCKRRS